MSVSFPAEHREFFRVPGAVLSHPLTVLALLLLLLNDHVLKVHCPSWLSGKLSDFAVLLLLPLWIVAAWQWGARIAGSRRLAAAERLVLVLAVALVGLFFIAMELAGWADVAYRYGLGLAQWPFRWALAWLRDGSGAAFAPVQATPDPTDLLALPTLGLSFWLGTKYTQRPRRSRPATTATRVTALLVLLGSSLWSSGALASEPLVHDGFYLRLETGGGMAFVDSNSSISNGFVQPTPSSAWGGAFPSSALRLGGTLGPLALGGRFGVTVVQRPTIDTLDQELIVDGLSLVSAQLQAFASLYPDPRHGLHFDVEFGLGSTFVETEASGARARRWRISSERQLGPAIGLEAGYDFWLLNQWSGGPGLRFTAAWAEGERAESTFLLAEAVVGVTLH